jgi:hypothetical protein
MAVRPLLPRTRQLTVIAQDPRICHKRGPKRGRIVTAKINVPAEALSPGPAGYRVHCIDFDSTTETYYNTRLPAHRDPLDDPRYEEMSAREFNEALLSDPNFHCQNVYALVMHTLSRFEFALGRRLKWGFDKSHQLKVSPHAFAEANAFYSEEDQALLFGYFPSRRKGRTVFTCLSHDVIVHETTHALIDGLRTRFTDASSPDQAAFHEGFADVVALLSIFSLPSIAELVIDKILDSDEKLIHVSILDPKVLRREIGALAEEVGEETSGIRGEPLRRSMDREPGINYLALPEFRESHIRGEILSAAMMNAFIHMWSERLQKLGERQKGYLDRSKVVEEGADIAGALLTSAIRALDYVPAVHLSFNDYLSALLTADHEVRPGSDDRYNLRRCVLDSFKSYFIPPASRPKKDGVWTTPPLTLRYERTHFEPMQRDDDEVFHFLWENRQELGLHPEAFTYIQSVRPCVRIGNDGFMLRETVAEYVQMLRVQAGELESRSIKLKRPKGMAKDVEVDLYGGGALIFDEYGRLKYHVYNHVDGKTQIKRLEFLFATGFFAGKSLQTRFSSLHRMRSLAQIGRPEEGW